MLIENHACPADCPYQEAEQRQRAYRNAFIMQAKYNPRTRIYTARCASCGKVYRKIWWPFQTEDDVLDKLKSKFSAMCNDCGGWICKDCYIVCTEDDSLGICAKCLNKKGVRGLNMKQYDKMLRKHLANNQEQIEKNRIELMNWLRNNEKWKTGHNNKPL